MTWGSKAAVEQEVAIKPIITVLVTALLINWRRRIGGSNLKKMVKMPRAF